MQTLDFFTSRIGKKVNCNNKKQNFTPTIGDAKTAQMFFDNQAAHGYTYTDYVAANAPKATTQTKTTTIEKSKYYL